jgi:hypothetical protein
MTVRSRLGFVATLAIASTLWACAASPRQRPVEGGPVNTGTGSLAAARKFLEGRWTLERFEVFPPGGQPIALTGSGLLTYDGFGNMTMEVSADEKSAKILQAAGVETRNGMISTSGRTVVDMQNRTLTFVLEGQKEGFQTGGPLAPSRPRHWEVTGDTLTLTTRDDGGNPLSIGRWKRAS